MCKISVIPRATDDCGTIGDDVIEVSPVVESSCATGLLAYCGDELPSLALSSRGSAILVFVRTAYYYNVRYMSLGISRPASAHDLNHQLKAQVAR